MQCGRSSVGRVSAFQADCREFESRRPLHKEASRKVRLFYCGGHRRERADSSSSASELSAEVLLRSN